MIERLFETEVGINTFVDPVFVWPRVLFYIAGFTAIAAAYFTYERAGGRLAPVGDFDEASQPELEGVLT